MSRSTIGSSRAIRLSLVWALLVVALATVSPSTAAPEPFPILELFSEEAGLGLVRSPRFDIAGDGFELRVKNSNVARLFREVPSDAWKPAGDGIRAEVATSNASAVLSSARVGVVATPAALQALGRRGDAAFVPNVSNLARALKLSFGARPVVAGDITTYRLLREAHPDALLLLQRSDDFAGLREMNRPLRIVVDPLVPTTEAEFVAVFHNRSPTPAQQDVMNAVSPKLARFRKGMTANIGDAPQEMARDRTLRLIKEASPDEARIIIAHNENGILRFPDRSSIAISELGATKHAGKIIIVSCNALKQVQSYNAILMASADSLMLKEAIDVATAIVPPGTEMRSRSLAEILKATGNLAGSLVGIAAPALFLVETDEMDHPQ